jgi:Leucine-rich repeat (LRR) protein
MFEMQFTGKDKNGLNVSIDINSFDRFGLERKDLSYIDLSPLLTDHANEVRLLCLHENHLTSIDLNPIKNCKNLQVLSLNYNNLIDLRSLADLKNFINCMFIQIS